MYNILYNMLIYNYLYYNYTISSISFMSAAKKQNQYPITQYSAATRRGYR